MSKKIYTFTDSLWSEITLSVLIGIPLIWTTTGLY
jgi:hypothetical protein